MVTENARIISEDLAFHQYPYAKIHMHIHIGFIGTHYHFIVVDNPMEPQTRRPCVCMRTQCPSTP